MLEELRPSDLFRGRDGAMRGGCRAGAGGGRILEDGRVYSTPEGAKRLEDAEASSGSEMLAGEPGVWR